MNLTLLQNRRRGLPKARSIQEALDLLGVTADTDPATVAHAYRRLARANHPDVSSEPDAAQRFASISAAYRLVRHRAATPPSLSTPRTVQASSPPQAPRARWEQGSPRPSQPHAAWPSLRAEPSSGAGATSIDLWPSTGLGRPTSQPLIVAGPVTVTPPRSESFGNGLDDEGDL